jgi:hypothetical protein
MLTLQFVWLEPAAAANLLLCWVLGRWQLFVKSGFRQPPMQRWDSQWALLRQALGAAALLAARHELHRGVVVVLALVASHLQAQPAQARLEGDGLGRPRAGVPGVAQIVAQLQREGAVARAHQGFGVGRRRARVPWTAALGVGQGALAGVGAPTGAGHVLRRGHQALRWAWAALWSS